jgi:hypothetical protein
MAEAACMRSRAGTGARLHARPAQDSHRAGRQDSSGGVAFRFILSISKYLLYLIFKLILIIHFIKK